MSDVPGIRAAYKIIKPECRSLHGKIGAWEAAVEDLYKMYHACANSQQPNADFHVVLYVDNSVDIMNARNQEAAQAVHP